MGGFLTQMKAQLARQQAEENGLSTQPVDDLTDLLGELSVTARTIALQLHPRVLDSFGLTEALSNLVGKLEDQHDLSITLKLDVEAEDQYSSLVERTAYRVVHGAVVNVVRHARPETVEVTLNELDTAVHIEVKDHGQGFDLSDRDHLRTSTLPSQWSEAAGDQTAVGV